MSPLPLNFYCAKCGAVGAIEPGADAMFVDQLRSFMRDHMDCPVGVTVEMTILEQGTDPPLWMIDLPV